MSVVAAGDQQYPYIAIYEIETTDIRATFAALQRACENGCVEMSFAFDYETVLASIYEPIGDVVVGTMVEKSL